MLYVSLLGLWFCKSLCLFYSGVIILSRARAPVCVCVCVYVCMCVCVYVCMYMYVYIYIYIYIYDSVSSPGTRIIFVVDIQKAFRIRESFHDVFCEMFNLKYVIIAVHLEHNKFCPEGPGWRDYLPCRLMTLDAK